MRRNWAKGLLFHERQPLAKRRCQPAASEIAVWRLNCWKNAGWGDHLSKIGLSDDAVTDVLDDLSDSVASEVADSSPWASELERIYSDGCIESSVDSIYQWGIAVVAKPLVGEALFRLRCRLKSSEWRSMEMASETERLFLPALKRRLTSLLRRAMILEVNVSRLHGSLNGESPQLRYLDFLRRFLDPANALAFWFEYPALARLVVTIINQWEKNTELFLRRLALDAEDLSAVLTCARPRAIRKVRVGAGDPHRGGQSVTLVEFDSGTRAVYKPRPQAVEKHFRELCDWVNAGLGTSFFHIPAALDRGEYGWAEYIPHKPCANGEEIRLFYLQQGGLLALLHLLQGVDIHSENIIASGKNPVVVDLETLFHPDMAAIEAVSLPDSYKMYQDSALRCHLLPRRWVGEFNEVGRDMSGMGAVPGELWDEAASVTENFHTDEIRITKKRLPSKGTNHLPSVDESPGALADHVGQVEEGFVAVYRLLLAERESLKCPGSPLLAFLNDEVRVVVRPTQEYARLHEEGLHPDLVQDALNREGFLGQLWRRGRIDSWIKRLVPAELKDLHNGDIPYFTARPASRHLWASDGSAIEDILPAPMMSVVLARLDRMNQEDLDRQLSYIRSAIASTVRTIPEVRTNASSSATTASNLGDRGVEKGEVLEWADEIGAKILKLSFRSDSGISWLGLTLVGPDCWELLPLKPDLYSGTSGIALFLGFLGSLTGKAHYCEAAKEVITSARLNLRQLTHQIQRIGAYMGLGGYLYCLAELSDILNLPNTDSEIGRIVRLIESGIELDSWYDVIAGSAGVLAVALRVHEKWDNPLLLRLADSCALRRLRGVSNPCLPKFTRQSVAQPRQARTQLNEPLSAHRGSGCEVH